MELTRRWVAALVMVAPEDRERLVAEVESRVAALYDVPPSRPMNEDRKPEDEVHARGPDGRAVKSPTTAGKKKRRSAKARG